MNEMNEEKYDGYLISALILLGKADKHDFLKIEEKNVNMCFTQSFLS